MNPDIKYSDDRSLARLEREAVNAVLDRESVSTTNIQRDLELELAKCYALNSYYFTMGGLAVGTGVGLMYKTLRPIAIAAVISPMLDLFYETSACSELQNAYNENRKETRLRTKQMAEEAIMNVRRRYREGQARD